MKNIIASIRDALEKEACLPALALALTIPDVCGKVAYPDITGKGATGNRYKKWFEEYVQKYYWGPSESTEEGHVYFNSDMCYALRNKVLHENRSDIAFTGGEREGNAHHEYDFKLVVNGGNSFGSLIRGDGKNQCENVHVGVDVKDLCVHLCDEAERFAEQPIGIVLERFDIELIDIQVWAEVHTHGDHAGADWAEVIRALEGESEAAQEFEEGEPQ